MIPWLDKPWFSYPISRPLTIRRINPIVLVVGITYVVFITLINVVAVGYEYKTVISADFNNPNQLWYENFLAKLGGLPKTWQCNASTVKVAEGIPVLVMN